MPAGAAPRPAAGGRGVVCVRGSRTLERWESAAKRRWEIRERPGTPVFGPLGYDCRPRQHRCSTRPAQSCVVVGESFMWDGNAHLSRDEKGLDQGREGDRWTRRGASPLGPGVGGTRGRAQHAPRPDAADDGGAERLPGDRFAGFCSPRGRALRAGDKAAGESRANHQPLHYAVVMGRTGPSSTRSGTPAPDPSNRSHSGGETPLNNRDPPRQLES